METSELPLILENLKALLKKKKITYKMLGDEISLSESGVKKIFKSSDVSFNRLNQICNVVDTSLADLIAHGKKKNFEAASFSPELEKYFHKNYEAFEFYWLLVAERRSLKEVSQVLGLDKKTTFKYLNLLDKNQILTLGEKDKIKINYQTMKRWIGKGPLTLKVQREWANNLIEETIKQKFKNNDEENLSHQFRHLHLTELSYREFKKALEDLELEFLNRSRRELALNEVEEMVRCRYLNILNTGSFITKN